MMARIRLHELVCPILILVVVCKEMRFRHDRGVESSLASVRLTCKKQTFGRNHDFFRAVAQIPRQGGRDGARPLQEDEWFMHHPGAIVRPSLRVGVPYCLEMANNEGARGKLVF
jgi:hypothetical protein